MWREGSPPERNQKKAYDIPMSVCGLGRRDSGYLESTNTRQWLELPILQPSMGGSVPDLGRKQKDVLILGVTHSSALPPVPP